MKHYKERIIEEQKYYATHVMAMTVESLHSKSDIAAELAHRDEVIDILKTTIVNYKISDKALIEEIIELKNNRKQLDEKDVICRRLKTQLEGKKEALREAYKKLTTIASIVTKPDNVY